MMTVRTTNLFSNTERLRFSISPPKMIETNSDNTYIKIKGWTLGSDGAPVQLVLDNLDRTVIYPSISRPDVALVHADAVPTCGFEFYIEAGKDIKIGAILAQETVWLACISFDKLGVLQGYDSYLFLDNDSNKSLSQYTGDTLIDDENLKTWENYFLKIEEQRDQLGFSPVFLIAPGKEFIFPDKYPAIRKNISTLDQFICRFPKPYILNPIDRLHTDRNSTYSKIDTHWTDFGGRVVAELVCQKLNQAYIEPGNAYSYEKTYGDLGSKVQPNQYEYIAHYNASAVIALRVFDNAITNRGRIHVYHNASSLSSKSCIVFGDSFSNTLVPQLVNSFRRVVHVFSGADIDWNLVEHERPDYLISEMTTRFFIKAPSASFSVLSEISRKYSTYNEDKSRREHIRLLANTDPAVQFYKNICIDALKNHL